MQDYPTTKCTKRCAVSDRPFVPGESYIAVLTRSGDEIVRSDVAASSWNGPQENTVGWWRCAMPAAAEKKLVAAPNGVLLDTLTELLETPGKEGLTYLLALLLVRRRVLAESVTSGTLEGLDVDSREIDGTKADGLVDKNYVDESYGQLWELVCQSDGRTWTVPVADSSPSDLFSLHEELNQLLFTEV